MRKVKSFVEIVQHEYGVPDIMTALDKKVNKLYPLTIQSVTDTYIRDDSEVCMVVRVVIYETRVQPGS